MKCSNCKYYVRSKVYGNSCSCAGIKPYETQRKYKQRKVKSDKNVGIMSREIIFRGKSKRNGEWLYGDLEYNRQKDIARIHTYNKDGTYEGQDIVDNETVGQFTGLLDKNGKEIYEGDIVQCDVDIENCIYSVVFCQGMFCAHVIRKEGGCTLMGGYPLYRLVNHVLHLCEVIGNRYDNPELLKEGKQ